MKTEIQDMVDWVNANEVFWLRDFKKQFNITETPKSDNFNIATQFIDELKKRNHIQCCEKIKSERKYILVTKIEFVISKYGSRTKKINKIMYRGLLGYRTEFFKSDEVISMIEKSVYFYSQLEEKMKKGCFTLFSTNKQHTWVCASNQNLFIVLDDLDAEEVTLLIRFSIDRLDEILSSITFMDVDKNCNAIRFIDVSRIIFCSKSLHQTKEDVIRSIKNLIKD